MITADEIHKKMLQDMEDEVSKMIQDAIKYIEEAILKAVAEKKTSVALPIRKKCPVLLPLRDDAIYKVITRYLGSLGFCGRRDDYPWYNYLVVSWEIPQELFIKTFEACTADSRLKHLLMTGHAPKVVVGEDDSG